MQIKMMMIIIIDMLDSDWCIVGSRMTAMTLDVKLDWNIILF